MDALRRLSRRRVLRGMLQGSAVTVALPMLDCFLNGNGQAFADGARLPTRFVNWFWHLGCTPGRWEPRNDGSLANQRLGAELVALEPVKDKINIYSMMKVALDGRPNVPHRTGWEGQLMGAVSRSGGMTLPTIDTLIAESIGTTTRFRSLVASSDGSARSSVSYLAGGVQQAAEPSPTELYARIFGPEFKDPNSATFTPDSRVMARRSVLSAIRDDRQAMSREVGAGDRARLDEYFTSLRQLERQLEAQLEKPAPMAACTRPPAIESKPVGTELESVLHTNRLMSSLIAHALACDQTRVASLMAGNNIRVTGDPVTYHTYTHQEQFDSKLGYQPKVDWFATRVPEGLATLIQILHGIKEGDGTLLDRTLVLATTDCSNAFTHQMENVPIITAGRASGRMKTGLHVRGAGDPATRVGLTVMQAMGMPVGKFGADSNETTRSFSEVLV